MHGPDGIFSEHQEHKMNGKMESLREMKSNFFRYKSSRNQERGLAHKGIFSHDDINPQSIDSERKSNYAMDNSEKANHSYEIEVKKADPINLEISRRILAENKSESTFLQVENPSENNEVDDICFI